MAKKHNITTTQEINEILSQALWDVSKRKISLKQAQMISRLATTLSKNIQQLDLKERVDALEGLITKRRR